MNPYDVLELEPGAANASVIQAVARALKARRFEPKTIAEAQKALLDPGQRPLADFMRPAIPRPRRFVPPAEEPAAVALPNWPEQDPAGLLAALTALIEGDRRDAATLAPPDATAIVPAAYPQRLLEIEGPRP